MLIAKLTIGFDRGAKRNAAQDLGLEAEPTVTNDGEGLVRGLGTHYISAAERDRVQECEAEDRRVRKAFGATFVAAPIPGTYVVTSREAAEATLRDLAVDSRLSCRVQVYDLSPHGTMAESEMRDWTDRVKRQLTATPIGRKEVRGDGLAALEALAKCPLLDDGTADRLRKLIAQARVGGVDAPEFRRRLAAMPVVVRIAPAAAPRRPHAAMPAPVGV